MNENTIYLKAFGETVEIQTASPFLVRAIIEPDTKIEHLAETQISNQTLLIYIDENDIEGKGVERRQAITVRGQLYRIVEIGNDMNGMAVFRVSKS